MHDFECIMVSSNCGVRQTASNRVAQRLKEGLAWVAHLLNQKVAELLSSIFDINEPHFLLKCITSIDKGGSFEPFHEFN